MDANLQHPFQLANREDWRILEDPAGLVYDSDRRSLRLTSSRPRGLSEDETLARARLELAPGSLDRFATSAVWDPEQERVIASGAFPGAVPIFTPPPGSAVSDVAIGYDGVLYLAVNGGVSLVDLHRRWAQLDLAASESFGAWRLASASSGGVYALDRAQKRLARVRGLPLRPLRVAFAADVFRPDPEDPDPPRLWLLTRAVLPDSEEPVAIASSANGRLAVLSWVPGADARVRVLQEDETLGPPQVLVGTRFPFSLTFVDEERVAVLLTGLSTAPEALVFPLLAPSAAGVAVHALPLGDIYPLRGHSGGPFLHGTEAPPAYPTSGTPAFRRLLRIASPSYLQRGSANNARSLDSGAAGTVWHRLYLEANIPAGCAARVWLAASEEEMAPSDAADWYEHRFGLLEGEGAAGLPRGAWLRERSEIPFHPGLLCCPSRPGEAGLFTALVQRAGRRVRALAGRYLWLRLELVGNGRSTPEIAAARVYAPRRSYTQYLPELYRESLFGPEADEIGPSTRPDFLERFLGVFESVLTPLESRVRDAYVVTTPQGVPTDALEWLASWIGFVFVEGLPEDRRRALLAHARELCVRRGTLAGLRLALDLVSGGAVQRGAVLVVEDFRLRRTFATILGANLASDDDALLPGLTVSGNSIVGDTLFLGDEDSKEFLALFGEGASITTAERNAVGGLFDKLAHRATVLVHSDLSPQDLGLINAVVSREAPAHVEMKVIAASHRFMVGLASLIGVDTFVERKPPAAPAHIGGSTLGDGGTISHLASLDPRLGSSPAEQPVAGVAAVPPSAAGEPFTLDGSASRAAAGRRLVRYHWTLLG